MIHRCARRGTRNAFGRKGCRTIDVATRCFAAPSKVVVASDSSGVDLKIAIVEHLRGRGMPVQDLGTGDYHAAATRVAKAVQEGGLSPEGDSACRGMLFSGSGIGAAIVANKFRGIYAAVAESEDAARTSRALSNANVVTISSYATPCDLAACISDAFLEQEFASAPIASGSGQGSALLAPAWWTPELQESLKSDMAKIAAVERDAVDQAVSAFLMNSAPGDLEEPAGSLVSKFAESEKSHRSAPPTPPPPSPARGEAFAQPLTQTGAPPTPPPPPLPRKR